MFININRGGKPISYLLNNMYVFLSSQLAPIFAIAIWLVMSFYLLICLIKGNMILNATKKKKLNFPHKKYFLTFPLKKYFLPFFSHNILFFLTLPKIFF